MKKNKALKSKFTKLQCSETYLFCLLYISKTCSYLKSKKNKQKFGWQRFSNSINVFFSLSSTRLSWVSWTETGDIWYKMIAGWEEPEFKRHFYLVKHWDSCLKIYAVLNWNGLRIFPVVTLIYVPVNSTLQGLINCSLLVLLVILI